jgi:hypothetical protein
MGQSARGGSDDGRAVTRVGGWPAGERNLEKGAVQ